MAADDTYDAVLIPFDQYQALGATHEDQLRAVRVRYGHLLGKPPEAGRCHLYRHDCPALGATLISLSQSDTFAFPTQHPLGRLPRYDWFELEDGAKVGVLKPDPYATAVHKPVGFVVNADEQKRRHAALLARNQARGIRAEDSQSLAAEALHETESSTA